MGNLSTTAYPRAVGFPLGIAIFLLPVFFVWFLLRQGYSTTARIFGFGWLAAIVLLMAAIGGAGTLPNSSDRGGDAASSSGAGNMVATSTPASQETSNTPSPAAAPPLNVASWHCGDAESPEFIETTGQVKNVSGEPLKNVEVVAQYFTADGTFVRSDDAIIEYNPVMPGQVSPFKTIGTSNPLIKKCQLSFKDLLGGTIDATIPDAK